MVLVKYPAEVALMAAPQPTLAELAVQLAANLAGLIANLIVLDLVAISICHDIN